MHVFGLRPSFLLDFATDILLRRQLSFLSIRLTVKFILLLELLLQYPALATPRFPANPLRTMSAILSADDLNDFISPGVACIKPIETLPAQQEETSVRSLFVLA